MSKKFSAAAVLLGAMASAAPSPAAVNPTLASQSFVEDDLSGSGQEGKKPAVKRPSRRAPSLRLRFDGERAALARFVRQVPALINECFPELPRTEATAEVLLSLVRTVFEWRSVTVETITAESRFAPEIVEQALERCARAGLISVKDRSADGLRWILPEPALRGRGTALVDRLWLVLDTMDAPAPTRTPTGVGNGRAAGMAKKRSE
jgi:hypothetical protein